jgi:hypothetical protein
MRVNIDQLSDASPIWIFGISPSLDAAQSDLVLRHVDAFLDNWTSHGTPIRGARDLREGSFLIVAADEASEKSGCSIDRMFGTLKQLEHELNVQILDANRVFLRHDRVVRAVPRHMFRDTATADTPVFDITAQRLGEVRNGSWERRAGDSWHRQLLASA